MENVMERTSSWANIGTEVNTSKIAEALAKAGLDYEVGTIPLSYKNGDKEIIVPDRVASVRLSDNHYYGVVSTSYTQVQNKEAFEFLNYIDQDIKFVRAGETSGGMVYIIGELQEMNILGDEFKLYAIFQNGHNGRYQLAASICPLRIVCQNQFNLAFKETANTFVIRHTKKTHSRMAAGAETLKAIGEYSKLFNEKAQLFAKQKVTPAQVEKFINFMFPIKEDATDAAKEKIEAEKGIFLKAYNSNDNLNFRGSSWGLINGLTDYITHKEFKRKVENPEEKKFVSTIFVADQLHKSMAYLTNMVG